MPIVYWDEDDGALYGPDDVEAASGCPAVEGFTRYEIPESVTLTLAEILDARGDLLEALMRTGRAAAIDRTDE